MLVNLRCQIRRLIFFCLKKLNDAFSTVGNTPFFETSQFDWINLVEVNADIISREFQTIVDSETLPNVQDISPAEVNLSTDQKWKVFGLYYYRSKIVRNCTKCPKTEAILTTIPSLNSAFFSVLAPHKHVPPHQGIYNGILRCHLGLQVPTKNGQCGIKVGEITNYWQAGKTLVFNDAYQHEAWNDTEFTRIILVIDFERPLRWPMNIINRWAITYIASTPLITEPLKNLTT